jgi:hypothetical protein
MSIFLRLGLGLAFAGAMLGLVFSGCLTLPGMGNLGLTDSFHRLEQQHQRAHELSRHFTACQRRNAAFERITRDLCARRLTLLEAASRLRHLAEEEPAWPRYLLRRDFPAGSDEECFCRIAIAAVRDRLSTTPRPQGPAILERLEAELEWQVARGTLRLAGR